MPYRSLIFKCTIQYFLINVLSCANVTVTLSQNISNPQCNPACLSVPSPGTPNPLSVELLFLGISILLPKRGILLHDQAFFWVVRLS